MSDIAQLKESFPRFVNLLNKSLDVILEQKISKYPVFIFSQNEIDLGVKIYEKLNESDFNVRISTLEELVSRQVISEEKIADFQQVYKDPAQFFCLLFLSDENDQFVFVGRRNEVFSQN